MNIEPLIYTTNASAAAQCSLVLKEQLLKLKELKVHLSHFNPLYFLLNGTDFFQNVSMTNFIPKYIRGDIMAPPILAPLGCNIFIVWQSFYHLMYRLAGDVLKADGPLTGATHGQTQFGLLVTINKVILV